MLGGNIAGVVARQPGGRLRFDYDENYRSLPSPTPVSVSMPTQVPAHPDRVIRPWLWGLLPENEDVLKRWERQFHASASSPFSMLSTPIGHDCAGAVRFAGSETVDELLTRPGTVQWLTEREVAERIRDLRRDATSWLGRTFTGQFSLAGAQAKTALLLEDGRWGVPLGSAATSHILKPAVAGLDDHDLNEHLCLNAARRAGLTAVRTSIAQFEDQTAIVVQRYDRRREPNGGLTRIHQEDLCQALSLPPTKKYQNEGGPSPADIARLLRKVMPAAISETAIATFLDGLAWNWIIAGTDAHAKNYSLLMAGNELRLAPLYDVASALPYGIHERRLRLAMAIGRDYRVFPERNRWPEAAEQLGIDPEVTVERVKELAESAPDAFRDAAAEPAVVKLERGLPDRLVDLVADRARRCLKVLTYPSPRPMLRPQSRGTAVEGDRRRLTNPS